MLLKLLIGCVFMLLITSFSFIKNQKLDLTINESIKKASQFLKHIQRSDGAICDTTNRLFDTWETIIATSALLEAEKDTSHYICKKALSYLKNNENNNGLICHNSKCKQAYCLETTSVYYLLLLQIGDVQKVKFNLKKIGNLQKSTGQWEIGNPDVREQLSFPSVTAFALSVYSSLNLKPSYENEALNWLIKTQKTQGNWGTAWEYYGNAAYAIWPIMKIKKGNKNFMQAKQKANEYIINTQLKDGSWNLDSTTSKAISIELQTSLMLNSLQNYDELQNAKPIKKAIDFLLKSQKKEGSWEGGFFPIPNNRYEKKEYVFATSLALIALNKYRKQCKQ